MEAPRPLLENKPRRWVYPEATGRARELARETRVSPLLAELLVRRGIASAEAARAFLEPALSQLHDPALLPDMERAVARLSAAIDGKEPVLLYADYDVDGLTGAAILFDILSRLGADVRVHVPDRVRDGYGMKVERLRRAREEGVRVVVSIDNGVAALDEAKACLELGIDLIVTDHHTMKPELPRAHAVVHPRVPGSTYPNPDICGAGVAFKLAWAVARARNPGETKKPAPALRERLMAALGLVALGTVADVVPLRGENRALVQNGLKVLERAPTPGIKALLVTAELLSEEGSRERALEASDVAFRLAPRLNAAGRMGEARRAFDLLVAATDREAEALALELDRENARRQGVQKDTTEAARAEVLAVYSREGDSPASGIVVAGEWPLGVVGIVAAKLVEEYRRPVLVLALDGEKAKGSGRSVPGVDLLRCLERAKEHLATWGGHAAACGLSLERSRLAAFREAWTAAVLAETSPPAKADGDPAKADGDPTKAGPSPGEHVLEIDLEVALEDVHHGFLTELSLLEPFGQGNRPPVLAARDLELAGEPRPMGRAGDHVSFFVRQGDSVLRTIAFGRRDLLDLLRARAMAGPSRERFELAFRPKLNRWNGRDSVELELEDLRFPG